MDDKRLDDLLHGLKDNYERLPEYADAKKIVNDLPEKRKKRKRFVVIPLVAVFTGFLLFFILAMPTVENYQNAAYSKEQLVKYAEQKKEAFRLELGVESVDDFVMGEDIQQFINGYKEPIEKEDFEEAKDLIDNLFTTPASAINELNKVQDEDRTEQWLSVNYKMGIFKQYLDQYFSQLKIDYGLDAEKQEALYDNQADYSGPIEIVEFLNIVHEQGYYLEKTNHSHFSGQEVSVLDVRIDYKALLDQVEEIEGDEGIRRYLTFISEKMDVQNGGINNSYDIPWYEFDDVLLELEDIYRSYPEYREFFQMYSGATFSAAMYLNDYLNTGMMNHLERDSESELILEEELKDFAAHHQDSIFWPVVAGTLADIENGEWPAGSNFFGYEMHFIFNTVEDAMAYDRLYSMYDWPISNSTRIYYSNYQARENISVIKELSPYDFLSMYIYAESQDEGLYEELYAGETEREHMNWDKLVNEAFVLVENELNEARVEFTFISLENDLMENEPIATVTLQNKDGWEVIEQEILE